MKYYSKYLMWALILAVVVRILIFAVLCLKPFPYSEVGPVSPLITQKGADMPFYRYSENLYFKNRSQLINLYLDYYKNFFNTERPRILISGPLFPAFIHFSDYKDKHTFPLVLFYLILGIALVAVWLKWFDLQDAAPLWLFALGLMPHLIWFSVYVSSDLLYALFFGIFFISTDLQEKYVIARKPLIPLMALLLMLLTRPTALPILILFMIYRFWKRNNIYQNTPLLFFILTVTAITFTFFYAPYCFEYLNAGEHMVFGIPGKFYEHESPSTLLEICSYAGQFILLILGKILYVVGIEPSRSHVSYALVLRLIYGFPMLLGLIYLFLSGTFFQKLICFAVVFPMLVGLSTHRYTLPIEPLLFFYGTKKINNYYHSLKKKRFF